MYTLVGLFHIFLLCISIFIQTHLKTHKVNTSTTAYYKESSTNCHAVKFKVSGGLGGVNCPRKYESVFHSDCVTESRCIGFEATSEIDEIEKAVADFEKSLNAVGPFYYDHRLNKWTTTALAPTDDPMAFKLHNMIADNFGNCTGKEAVQAILEQAMKAVDMKKGFVKITTDPGRSQETSFKLRKSCSALDACDSDDEASRAKKTKRVDGEKPDSDTTRSSDAFAYSIGDTYDQHVHFAMCVDIQKLDKRKTSKAEFHYPRLIEEALTMMPRQTQMFALLLLPTHAQLFHVREEEPPIFVEGKSLKVHLDKVFVFKLPKQHGNNEFQQGPLVDMVKHICHCMKIMKEGSFFCTTCTEVWQVALPGFQ